MNKRVSVRLAPVIAFGLLALSVGVFVSGPYQAQARAASDKASNEKVLKLAAAIKAGDKAAVKKLSPELAKVDLDDVMAAFKTRTKKGIGVGKKGSIAPDGIELKLQAMGRDAPGAATLTKDGKALEEMAYNIAAVAEVLLAQNPPKGSKGKKEDWIAWSKEMKEASESLTKAIKSKSGQDVKTISSKINNNCSACHSVFKAG